MIAIGWPDIAASQADAVFYVDEDPRGLTLHRTAAPATEDGLRLDFTDGSVERRLQAGRKSPLARALGLHRRPVQRVLDTTCGLGRDAAVLAALGCEVVAIERHALLFALLDDARRRAADECAPAWLDRWPRLIHADARQWLENEHATDFDAIYIDPMFAAPRRKAKPQKALAWLGELVGVDDDASQLLSVARRRARRRVVVKQHARSQPLVPPDRQVRGKAVRFDIYLADTSAQESIRE